MARSVKALITPKVLKWAREKRIRLDIEFAAERLKISPDRLEKWENGTEHPTFAQLKKIAKLYRTHLTIFYLPTAPKAFLPLIDYRVIPKSKKPDPDQEYNLKANIVEAHERRQRLIGIYELLEQPPPNVSLKVNIDDSHKIAAKQITKFLEFEREDLPKTNDLYNTLKFWKQTIEAKGILVCHTSVYTHLSLELETVRGFCIAQKPFPLIVINQKDRSYGRVFTIIHELVHIASGKSIKQNTGYSDRRKPSLNETERFCNMVAGEVLVPENELLEIIGLNTLKDDIPKLSKHFQVSNEVILRRLLILNIIPQHKYYAYRKIFLQNYKVTKDDTKIRSLYYKRLLNTSGEYYARAAFNAYHENKFTLADLSAAFYNCDTKHLTEIQSEISA